IVMSWERELEELRQRQALAQQMGGEEKVARQRAAGRLTVRERLATLLDAGTFHELGSVTGVATHDESGAITGLMPTNFVFGRGCIGSLRALVAGGVFRFRRGRSDA